MKSRQQWRLVGSAMLALCVWLAGIHGGTAVAQDDDEPAAVESSGKPGDDEPQPQAVAPDVARKWLDRLASGYTAAQRDRKPILVRAVGRSCPHCKRLAAEMLDPQVQEELGRWILVEVDVDAAPDDARLLRVGAIPALRLLTPRGKVVVGTDGAAEAADVVEWLQANYDEAAAAPAEELIGEEPPGALEVIRIVREFQQRDATLREAAVRRLLPHPQAAATVVVGALTEGTLSTRLTALELLREWKAPVDGLDPWQPQTLTDERIEALADWSLSDEVAAIGTAAEPELTADELKQAADDIARMIAAEPATAQAIRERLARFRGRLLPEVYRQLEQAETDQARQRLTALRYRLAATDRLVLDWPGGLERLAGADEEARHRAADELARRAVPADEPLLLELFSDPAPLVREISLQALQKVGGAGADGALIRLLHDPEPNVRAAVLKQLGESPSEAVVLKVAEYVAGEEDADLVVHAVRVLRQGPGGLSLPALKRLLEHESWRVRAEAAEAIAKSIGRGGSLSQSARADAYAELVELLKDEDGFVVSRAIEALAGADLVTAVQPLIAAAERHPELAAGVVAALSRGTKQGRAAIPHLRKFATHEEPQVRAAAIAGLSQLTGTAAQPEILAGLDDGESVVRIAAARALLQLLGRQKAGRRDGRIESDDSDAEEETAEPKSGLLTKLFDVFRGKGKTEQPPAEPADEAATDDQDTDPQPQPAEGEDADGPAKDNEETPGELQQKLLRIRDGKTFSKWQHDTEPALLRMLSAADAQERLAAALALAALGRDESSVPALTQLLETHPQLAAQAAAALEWLLWDDRERLFERIVEASGSVEAIGQVLDVLSRSGDPRSTGLIWPLLAHDRKGADPRLAATAQQILLRIYFPNSYYNIAGAPQSKRQAATADLVKMAETGSKWQQLTALSILLSFDQARAGELAGALYEAANDDELKADLFRIRLLSLPAADAVELATSVLTSEASPSAAAGLGLSLLTQGAASLSTMKSLPVELHVAESSSQSMISYGETRPILPEAPPGLKKEAIAPLLESDDPAVAAQAGYLLVLLDEPRGLEPLLTHWRGLKEPSLEWDRLVYRAIVYVDDADHLDALNQIYSRMDKKDVYSSGVREFYWTIRSMTARNVLEFRGQVRDEIGVENLR